MNIFINKLPLLSRVLISALFLLSALAKLYPTPLYGITKVFEEGQLIPMGFSEGLAPFISRIIIGFEFFIAFAILQRKYIKKLVVPSTILLLLIFSIDLSIKIFSGDTENCGCFGQLIPMTPLEALIKNIFTLLLLFYIYKNVEDKKDSNFLLLLSSYLLILVMMFSLLPIPSNSSAKQMSSFSSYVEKDFDINNGKKILCFFPDVHIVFSDTEEAKIPDFLNYAGKDYSYQVVAFYNPDDEINSYLEILGFEYENPVVIYLNNGNQMRFFDGTSSNQFVEEDFKNIFK